ncbi:MAG: tRNA (N6-isopentenyl adenosine(37)-C2)-methylthiotransferase MiaB [Kiloniellales bacterium]
MAKQLFIKTYGCQMNVYDSARMADVLAPLGYVQTELVESADLVILNTCHIRERAAEKVYSELGRLKVLKAERQAAGGSMTLAVAGCVAQAEGEELRRRAPQVDLVFGPQTYHRLPEMLVRLDDHGGGAVELDFQVEAKFDSLPEECSAPGVSAFLTVQEGCDRFCSFCVVPYTRGAEYSRTVVSVVAEAERLVAQGACEITLLGQNVNAYHGAGPGGHTWGLGRLLRRLSEIEAVARLRYTTSHPRDLDQELIAAHGELDKLMPFLHLPVQSGCDRILAAMNRRHTADDYRRLIDRLRLARPNIALSSDFIVGFPGESDRDFAETLRLVTEIQFTQAYSFKYSARPGTPAAALEVQVPDAVKRERLAMLQDLLEEQQRAFNLATVGKRLPVLLEKPGRKEGQLGGRSPYMQAVSLMAPRAALGEIVEVEIEAAEAFSLRGRLLSSDRGARAIAPKEQQWEMTA